jgi:hypothetical protein
MEPGSPTTYDCDSRQPKLATDTVFVVTSLVGIAHAAVLTNRVSPIDPPAETPGSERCRVLGHCALRRGKGCRPFPRAPFSAGGIRPLLRFGWVSLDEAEHFLHNRVARVANPDCVRDRPGMPFGLLDSAFGFAGIPTYACRQRFPLRFDLRDNQSNRGARSANLAARTYLANPHRGSSSRSSHLSSTRRYYFASEGLNGPYRIAPLQYALTRR